MANSNYLKINFAEYCEPTQNVNHYEFRAKPFSNSDVFLATIENCELLSKGGDVKRVYDLKLNTTNISHDFTPGDTIGILPRNSDTEVDEVLFRLKIDIFKEKVYELNIVENTAKKNPKLPKHIPTKGIVKDIFTYYVDLRKPPKKLFLKALIPFTTNTKEAELLQTICSPSGSKDYANFINEKAQTLLGLLDALPSCNPPIEIILEHSLPLHPRYYSISSSPLLKNCLHITFFVVDNSDSTRGICTGWLEDIIKKCDRDREKVPFYFRKPNNFRIPKELSTPLLMVATGTGIAPFVGFLQHRLLLQANDKCDIGPAYLFYGCRYPDRDYLYQRELQGFLKEKVLTKLHNAFSRSSDKKWYIQDEIIKNGEKFVNSVLCDKAVIYVCGDTKTVVKGVKDSLIHVLVVHGHLEEFAAQDYLNELVQQNRFIADCWS